MLCCIQHHLDDSLDVAAGGREAPGQPGKKNAEAFIALHARTNTATKSRFVVIFSLRLEGRKDSQIAPACQAEQNSGCPSRFGLFW